MKEQVKKLGKGLIETLRAMAMFGTIGAGCTLVVMGTLVLMGSANVIKK